MQLGTRVSQVLMQLGTRVSQALMQLGTRVSQTLTQLGTRVLRFKNKTGVNPNMSMYTSVKHNLSLLLYIATRSDVAVTSPPGESANFT
jgi:hypothetical protein